MNIWWYKQSIILSFTESIYGRIFITEANIFECSTTRIKWYLSTYPSLPTTGNDTIASAHLTWDNIPADDHELRLHYLAHKKVNAIHFFNQDCVGFSNFFQQCSPSVLLSEEEKMYLNDYKSNGSPKADLLFICASLLLKEKLTCEEDALLEQVI